MGAVGMPAYGLKGGLLPMELTNLDSPSMHFAVGMLLTGLLCVPLLFWRPRWWIYVPLLQTFGGILALVPDFALIPSYYPSVLPAVDAEATKRLFEGSLGNVFFFHAAIDKSGEGGFTRGFIWATVQYNFWILVFIASRHLSGGRNARLLRAPDGANQQVPGRNRPLVGASSRATTFDDILLVDQQRRVVALVGGSQALRGLELSFDALAGFSVLFNGEVIYQVERSAGCGGAASKSLRELESGLAEFEQLPLGPESKRSVDLRLTDHRGYCHEVNLYLRKGDYRYSKHSYARSTEDLVRICESLCAVLAGRQMQVG